jgi:hypothetical protein
MDRNCVNMYVNAVQAGPIPSYIFPKTPFTDIDQNAVTLPAVPLYPIYHGSQIITHRLNLSKLSRSPLLCLLTTPSLKYLSSPVAVLPPMYHFSCPSTSLNPSLLLSLPLLPLLDPKYFPSPGLVPGLGFLLGECRDVSAVVVAPVCCFVEVVMVRGCVGEV